MENGLQILDIKALEVLDSRGNPTIEVNVKTVLGHIGKAIVPSGASTGIHEAIELRDNDKERFGGKGVKNAVNNVNTTIRNVLIGMNAFDQKAIDKKLNELDGTKNKENLGANAILGVSLATCKVAAKAINMPLYRYIGGINSAKKMPTPMLNIINGGKHSENNLNIQEFMIVPIGQNENKTDDRNDIEMECNCNFSEKLRIAVEIYNELKKILKKSGKSVGIGDEGGFAPNLEGDEDALKLILEAIGKSGHRAGEDVFIALDIAASEMKKEAEKINESGKYYFWKTGKLKSLDDMIEYYDDITRRYPIISIEDGLNEDDIEGWSRLTINLSKKIRLVGDDLFVTSSERLKNGIENKCGNSILIKPNQIGTLTETLETINLARENNYETIISHRSGETEDSFIADLAVGLNAEKIKFGAPCRTDRNCKYNRLLEIEDELKTK